MIEYLSSFYIPLLCVFSALINMVVGIFVFVNNRKSLFNRHFFLFILSTIFWIISIYGIYHFAIHFNQTMLLMSIRLAYSFAIFIPLFLSSFFFYFPHPTFTVNKIIKNILVGIILFFAFVSFFTPWVYEKAVVKDNVYFSDIFGILYIPYVFIFVVSLIFTGIIGIYQTLKSQGIDRKKLMIALGGCWVFVFLIVMTNAVLPIFNIYIFQFEAVSFSLFFTIPAFYAIQKHRFFNLPILSLNILRTVVILMISFFGSFIFYQTLLHFS